MGTFHDNLGELHGITVVVDTHGDTVYVGRCHTQNEAGIELLDVGEHADGEAGRSKQDYLKRAAQVGVWKKHDRIVVPTADIASVTRLGEL